MKNSWIAFVLGAGLVFLLALAAFVWYMYQLFLVFNR